MYPIPFNKPYLPESFITNAEKLFSHADILRTFGPYYRASAAYLEKMYTAAEVVLTPSCTMALEMAAMLCELSPGDEVLMPSFTYVSTANAFIRCGAVPVFVDSQTDDPNFSLDDLESKRTKKTKAVVAVHYAGYSVDMKRLKSWCRKHRLILIEDAAHAIGASYAGQLLGTYGDIATLSFHETKNISCGQGGALIINKKSLAGKARVISQCGTNRYDFIQKKVTSYTWTGLGTNGLLNEPSCAVLAYQLKETTKVNRRRKQIWNRYNKELGKLKAQAGFRLPAVSAENEGNGHIFYLLLSSQKERDGLIRYLYEAGIQATFHYQALHNGPYFRRKFKPVRLPNSLNIQNTIIRLPLYAELTDDEQAKIIEAVKKYFTRG